jgi:hypothetical protein
MKRKLLRSLILTGIALTSATAFAATDAELAACFKAHARLMEKPALRTYLGCWRAHSQLMTQS